MSDVTPAPAVIRPPEARDLAVSLLGALPQRLAHSIAAGRAAAAAATVLAPEHVDVVVSAALLHDIGYSAALRDTGFHPLDGAEHLRRIGVPSRLAALVAHHSYARLVAPYHGVDDLEERYDVEAGIVADILVYADLTSMPDGRRDTVEARLAELTTRHACHRHVPATVREQRYVRLRAAADGIRAALAEQAG